MRTYGTIDSEMWERPEFHALTESAQKLACYLRTSKHCNLIWCFRMPMLYIAADMKSREYPTGWALDRVSKAMDELVPNRFALYCRETEYVYLPVCLEKFPIKGEKQATGAFKEWEKLPRKFQYLSDLSRQLLTMEGLSEGQAHTLSNRVSVTDAVQGPVPLRLQDQEQDPDQEQETHDLGACQGARPPAPALKTRRGKLLKGESLARFERFWQAFDYKRGKAEAADSWLALKPDDELAARIVAAAAAEAKRRPAIVDAGHTPKMAQGWLTARRWEDEHAPAIPKRQRAPGVFVVNGKEYRLPSMNDDVACCKLAEELGVSLRGLERQVAHARLRAELEKRAA